ncbi:potassium channel family protein [Clostridium tyrobutyricum]|uniref:potassium channel family protein n=1 Tax=Clostridium tyrobutyricum TaxID=1519 RepID=UPI001C380A6C|nr:potassium channel family protein [Clostridium tyrobutyricum]MBV4419500.1 potassium channel family protein [Clostridium tyrobutyricum]
MRIYKKHNYVYLLLYIYFFVLIFFGIIYWNIANHSRGEFFIFQNDINLDTKTAMFKKKMHIKFYSKDLNDSIKKLIISEEYKRPIVKLNILNNSIYNKATFVFDRVLGENWADYYYLIMESKGITHMSILDMGENKLNGAFDSHKIKICFYKLKDDKEDNFSSYKKNYSTRLKKINTIYIWVNNYSIINKEHFEDGYYYYPINFYFQELIKNSICFPDESPFILRQVSSGNFTYPIWNFIYFSAVTITTLGYGDILPNSTSVRIIVMIETVCGVIITGMLTSCIFLDKE